MTKTISGQQIYLNVHLHLVIWYEGISGQFRTPLDIRSPTFDLLKLPTRTKYPDYLDYIPD